MVLTVTHSFVSGKADQADATKVRPSNWNGPGAHSVGGTLDSSQLTNRNAELAYVIDGGGLELTTGVKGYLQTPFACTIMQASLLADLSGDITVDVWRCTFAQFDAGATFPTSADSITGSSQLTIVSTTHSLNTTLTGWNTSIASGDILAFNLSSNFNMTRVTVTLLVQKN